MTAQDVKDKAFRVVEALKVQRKCGRDTQEGIIRWTQIFEFAQGGFIQEDKFETICAWAEAVLEEHDVWMDE